MSHDRGPVNWQSWHNAALVAIGITLGDGKIMQPAIDGPSGVIWQLRHTLGRDGIYYSQSIVYHYFTMLAVSLTAAALAENGVGLYAHRIGERSLEAMYAVPFWHAFSNGNQAPFGNSQTNYTLPMQFMTSRRGQSRPLRRRFPDRSHCSKESKGKPEVAPSTLCVIWRGRLRPAD